MGRLIALILAALLLTPAAPAGAQIYQWMDKEGITHAASDLDSVPVAWRSRVQVISAAGRPPAPAGEYRIPFEKGPSGVILVQAVFDDAVGAKLVFDTGATLVLISDDLAARLEQTGSSRPGEKIRLKTAGGEVEAKAITIGKVEIMAAVRENVRAAISPRKPSFDGFDGLLGLSFLDGFKVVIDHQRQEIILYHP